MWSYVSREVHGLISETTEYQTEVLLLLGSGLYCEVVLIQGPGVSQKILSPLVILKTMFTMVISELVYHCD